MPFGCSICLVSLEKCPTTQSTAPTDGPSQRVSITAGPCGHVFHTLCIMQWMQRGEGCPNCRVPFEEHEMRELFCNKLHDDAPAVAWGANVEDETDIETLRTTLKNLEHSKQVDETIIQNLRSNMHKQEMHLRSKMFQMVSRYFLLEMKCEEEKELLDDAECLLGAEGFEAAAEIGNLKKIIAELEKPKHLGNSCSRSDFQQTMDMSVSL